MLSLAVSSSSLTPPALIFLFYVTVSTGQDEPKVNIKLVHLHRQHQEHKHTHANATTASWMLDVVKLIPEFNKMIHCLGQLSHHWPYCSISKGSLVRIFLQQKRISPIIV